MKVLLLGSGGREHALAWKLTQSPRLTTLLCAPGNVGTERLGQNVPLRVDDAAQVCALVAAHRVDLVVVGPEAPLVAGVADELSRLGVPVFGPVAAAARLEGSKAFAKEVMAAAGVPTASFQVFDDARTAEVHARAQGACVVKADGLAAGKGVIVARSGEEAAYAVRSLVGLGAAGKRLVVEELLEGEEVSVIALCDGERYALLSPAQDHKRVGEGDTGPNTGGMGAYAPTPFLSEEELVDVGRSVIAPTLAELARRKTPFKGALYAGLMLTRQGPRVLEFNCRFGDPEAQVLVMQLAEDLLPLLYASATGNLEARPLAVHPGVSVGVVLAAAGYPSSPRLGDPIQGLSDAEAMATVFHAGTRREGGQVVTAGGRVLTVCARGGSLEAARQKVYQAGACIRFEGMHYRRDIGSRALSVRS
ncbi:MAG: phosphoribosylamine--glycine ligase [Myxococcota bacterium]